MITKKIHIYLFLAGILILSLMCFFVSNWFKVYKELNTVRKTSPNYLKIVKLRPDEIILETEVDMTPPKLYFHNPFPRLTIGFKNSKYTREDISNLKIEVESVDKTGVSQKKFFKSMNFKYVDRYSQYLMKYIDKDFIYFYPVRGEGDPVKLAPGLNKYKITISGLSIINSDDIKAFLYFYETSNTMILMHPMIFFASHGTMEGKVPAVVKI